MVPFVLTQAQFFARYRRCLERASGHLTARLRDGRGVDMLNPSLERNAALLCVAAGFAIAASLSPWDRFFAPNLLFFWVPHIALLCCAALFRPRPAVIAGTALALAAYLAGYHVWVFSMKRPDSLAWLGYLFSLPGALLGAALAIGLFKERGGRSAMCAGLATLALVLAGIAMNLGFVCARWMHCR
jgi:hypothetical protein